MTMLPPAHGDREGPVRPEEQSGPEEATYKPSRDPLYTRVPNGLYVVGLESAKRRKPFGRLVWRTTWQIVEGPHLGERLYFFIPIMPEGAPPKRGYRMTGVYQVATGRPPPRDLWRRNPSSFLKDAYFEARVSTVKRDWQGGEVPEEARYSRITGLSRTVAGGPCGSATIQ